MIDHYDKTLSTRIDRYLYEKNYELLEQELDNTNQSHRLPEEQLMIQYTRLKISLGKTLQKGNSSHQEISFDQVIQEIDQKFKQKVDPDHQLIHRLAMEGFALEIGSQQQARYKQQFESQEQMGLEDQYLRRNMQNDHENQFLMKISELPHISVMKNNKKLQQSCSRSMYLAVSLIELYIKKMIKLSKKQLKNQLPILKSLVEEYSEIHPQVSQLTQKIYTIILHLILHSSNSLFQSLPERINHHIELCHQKLSQKNKLMNTETVVVYLYNVLKIMLGLNQIPSSVMSKLADFYRFYQMSNPGKNYSTHILQFFFIIKIEIFKSGKEQQTIIQGMIQNQKQEQMQASDFRISQLNEKFSCFLNINLDEVLVELNEITRNIIRHKVASLATIINLKLGIRRFSKDFLEIMHDSQFNNDIQTIKLCFELFEFRQFSKLQHLLFIVMAVPNNKHLNQKEVLTAMCSIFNGLYLANREQALLYCKLNHSRFLSMTSEMISSRKELLKEETLLQHVGFGYYNLAAHQTYLENRDIYLAKALENFLKSYEINKENYLLSYCIGKIYLQLYNYDKAYKYAIQSCKSHRGSWAPFCLLACVYFCQRKINKSLILVEQLLKKYHDVAILYYIRAYLQVNKLLLEVENDEEIEAAKILGDDFYLSHSQKILKSKSFHNIIKYCQYYFQCSQNQQLTQFDENYFIPQKIGLDITSYPKQIVKIIRLFIEVGQLNSIENLLKLLPGNHLPTMMCKGMLYEKRKQYKQAKQEYQTILNYDACYCEALIRLAYLEYIETEKREENLEEYERINPSDSENYQKQKEEIIEKYKTGLSYIEIAGKFTDSSHLTVIKGLLLSRIGKITQANLLLLKECEMGWCEELPDLLYYY